MVDSDMAPERDVALRLLDRDVDIVGAPYFGRRRSFVPHWLELEERALVSRQPTTPAGFREVLFAGGGCLLVRRRVLEAIPYPPFEYLEAPGRWALGEDVAFCAKARELGFKLGFTVHLDDQVVCDHVGVGRVPRELAAAWWATPEGRAEYARQTSAIEELRCVFTVTEGA